MNAKNRYQSTPAGVSGIAPSSAGIGAENTPIIITGIFLAAGIFPGLINPPVLIPI
jgi:hypothetical protein